LAISDAANNKSDAAPNAAKVMPVPKRFRRKLRLYRGPKEALPIRIMAASPRIAHYHQ
jgi:hypothetical protein